MSTSDKLLIEARHENGYIIVTMEGGLEIKFPVSMNPRLAQGNANQLANIEISPFGLHWPELDEDLSFKGLSRGDFGQHNNKGQSPKYSNSRRS